jgi:hypothetical protein
MMVVVVVQEEDEEEIDQMEVVENEKVCHHQKDGDEIPSICHRQIKYIEARGVKKIGDACSLREVIYER